jgi:hypothetical protein
VFVLFVRKKLTVIQEFSLFSFIGEKLKAFELTLTSYNALYEVEYQVKICQLDRNKKTRFTVIGPSIYLI